MAGKSNFLEDAILNHVFRGVAMPTFAASVYCSMHTADPGDTGASEVAVGSHPWYARVAVTRATGSWSAPADASGSEQIANVGAITFPSPTTSVTVTHFGWWDAATGGNFLYGGVLGTSRSLQNGDQAPSFAASALTVSEG
jgi:hypothetical protein